MANSPTSNAEMGGRLTGPGSPVYWLVFSPIPSPFLPFTKFSFKLQITTKTLPSPRPRERRACRRIICALPFEIFFGWKKELIPFESIGGGKKCEENVIKRKKRWLHRRTIYSKNISFVSYTTEVEAQGSEQVFPAKKLKITVQSLNFYAKLSKKKRRKLLKIPAKSNKNVLNARVIGGCRLHT